ncbi:MAG: RRXRR domain-containing protein [Paenibacillaceae bacterium]|nr:RRXRR domain-containing protein [Paenibacillaceae bacterium]
MVYVLSKTKKPLMPCSNVIARLLLNKKQSESQTSHSVHHSKRNPTAITCIASYNTTRIARLG